MSAAALLAHLHSAGISVSVEGDRLIVDAPAGVVTAELRAELGKRKAELIAALEADRVRSDKESILTEVRREIAELLAIAYRRYAVIQRVGTDRSTNPVTDALANFSRSSVHGDVP